MIFCHLILCTYCVHCNKKSYRKKPCNADITDNFISFSVVIYKQLKIRRDFNLQEQTRFRNDVALLRYAFCSDAYL